MLGLLTLVVDAAIVVGPVLGYVQQYREIVADGTSDGFSLLVPFILLASSGLRLLFRLGVVFETALVLQSFFMVAAQLALLHACLRFRRVVPKFAFTDVSLAAFWNYRTYADYLLCLATIFLFFAGLTVVLWGDAWFHVLGFVALMTEAMLGVPQLYRNHVNRSTHGLSTALIATWLAGDVSKAFYYWHRGSPMQFIVCAIVQISVDAYIIYQIATLGSGKQHVDREDKQLVSGDAANVVLRRRNV